MKDYIKRNRNMIVASGIYAVLCLALLTWYRYQINPDGISYITLAKKYAVGNFAEAINAYWSPLLSWLLAPFAFVHKNPQIAAKLINIVAGILTIVFCWSLFGRWRVNSYWKNVFLIVLIPLLIFWAMPSSVTPDLLTVMIFTIYLYFVTGSPSLLNSIILGCIGGIGYFAKAYFLPFFIAHTAIVTLYKYFIAKMSERRVAIKYALISCGIAIIIASPWITALTLKYHKLTYSTAGGYNFALLNPKQPGQVVNYIGLRKPPNPTAISMWEDPSYLPIQSWNPLHSKSDFANGSRVFFDGIKRMGAVFLELSAFAVAFVTFLVVYIFKKGRKLDLRIALIASACILYSLGYMAIAVEYRYYWPVFVGLLLLAMLLVQIEHIQGTAAYQRLAVIICIASITVTPLTQLYYQRNLTKPLRYEIKALEPFIQPGERVASDEFDTVRYCYYLSATCYGQFNAALDVKENVKQLSGNKITAVIIRNGGSSWQKPQYLSEYKEVTRVGNTILLKKN